MKNILAVAVGLLGFASAAHAGPKDAPATKPNVLFIAIDDLNDWVGVLGGHPQARTPNLDRLAQGGVRLERHYVYPTCSPTRAGLLTGRNPSRFAVRGAVFTWTGSPQRARKLGTSASSAPS